MVGPVVEELANDYEGKVVIGKVNVDNNTELSAKYGIRNIPTILFIKDGEVVDKSVGASPKNVLEEKIEAMKDMIANLPQLPVPSLFRI